MNSLCNPKRMIEKQNVISGPIISKLCIFFHFSVHLNDEIPGSGLPHE